MRRREPWGAMHQLHRLWHRVPDTNAKAQEDRQQEGRRRVRVVMHRGVERRLRKLGDADSRQERTREQRRFKVAGHNRRLTRRSIGERQDVHVQFT